MRLLLIETGQGNGEVLAHRLGAAGFRPLLLGSVQDALISPGRDNVAAILIDHGRHPELAVNSVISVRSAGMSQPMIVLSGRDDWREKVACLDAGADDFLVKPVRSEEIAARLRALVRRGAGVATDRILFGDIDLDIKRQCAWKGGDCLNLTRNEFRVLRLFLLNPGHVLRKDQIGEALREPDIGMSSNAIEVQIARLRRKLGRDSILTVRGLGYQLVGEPEQPTGPTPRSSCDRPPDDGRRT